jgi:hypothetical protein
MEDWVGTHSQAVGREKVNSLTLKVLGLSAAWAVPEIEANPPARARAKEAAVANCLRVMMPKGESSRRKVKPQRLG